MERAGNAAQCIKMLTRVKSEWLKDLERNRDVHAFQNGLYILSLNTFFSFKRQSTCYPNGEPRHCVDELSGNLVAIRYHDKIFEDEAMELEMSQYPERHFINIQMKSIHTIFDTQKFTTEERLWICALLGRMLHQLGKMDNFGVFPYFLGLAGTGKSTLLRLLSSLLEARDVGYLNNTLQKQFALEGIYDKKLYMALDIDENFQLDQATFQSMVVGEEVAVIRKFKQPITVIWDIHGGFAGNKLPPWTDNGGSLSRRLIVIEFTKMVKKCDPNLFSKCLNERDRFLKVINSAYHYICHHYKHRGIKEVIPERFLKSEKQALLELNSLMAFIKEGCILDEKEEKDTVQVFKDFNKAYKAFCRNNTIKANTLNYSTYNGVFAKFQVQVIQPKGGANNVDKFNQTSKYILGLRLNDSWLQEIQQN